MTWLSTSDFELYTGIVASSDVVVNALQNAEENIKKHIFISDVYKSGDSTTSHQIYPYIMDDDGDSTITTNDVEIYQEDRYGRRTYLSTSATEIDEYSGFVTFDISVPTDGNYNLVIQSKKGRDIFSKMLTELKTVEKLLAVNYLYEDIINKNMSGGVTNWTLNGVSIDFNSDGMRKTIEENNNKAYKLMQTLRPRTRPTSFKMGYNQHHEAKHL